MAVLSAFKRRTCKYPPESCWALLVLLGLLLFAITNSLLGPSGFLGGLIGHSGQGHQGFSSDFQRPLWPQGDIWVIVREKTKDKACVQHSYLVMNRFLADEELIAPFVIIFFHDSIIEKSLIP